MKKLLFLKGNAPYSIESRVRQIASAEEGCYSVDVIAISDYAPEAIVGYDAVVTDITGSEETEVIKSAVKALKLYSKVTLTADNGVDSIFVEPTERRISGTAEGGALGREVVQEERISFIEIEKTLRTAYGIAERSTRTVTDSIDKDNAYEVVIVADKDYEIDKAYVSVMSEIIYDYKDVRAEVVDINKYLLSSPESRRVVVSPRSIAALKAVKLGDRDRVVMYTGRDDRCLVTIVSGTPYLKSDTSEYDESAECAIRLIKELFLQK